MTILTAKP